MQWCQRLEANYGMDPWIWQSLDGPSFRHSSKLCLCNSFHGCFVPNSKKGQSVHILVFVLLEFHAFSKLYLLRIEEGLMTAIETARVMGLPDQELSEIFYNLLETAEKNPGSS